MRATPAKFRPVARTGIECTATGSQDGHYAATQVQAHMNSAISNRGVHVDEGGDAPG